MKKVAFLWFGALSLTQKDLQEEEDGDGWVQIPSSSGNKKGNKEYEKPERDRERERERRRRRREMNERENGICCG